MTPPDWASQRVNKALENLGCACKTCAAPHYTRLLRQEHARAVKVVKKELPDTWLHPLLTGPDALLPKGGAPITSLHVATLLHQIRKNVLAALQRGRTQKGTR